MIKQVSMMKRHPDLTMAAFVERYENHHAAFGAILFADAARFVRRYVQAERNPLTGQVADPSFDVIMEIWWHSREDYERAMAAIPTSGLIDRIRESGAALFASSDNPAFTVVEHDTVLRGNGEGAEAG